MKGQNFFADNPDIAFHLRSLPELFPFTSEQERATLGVETADQYRQTWFDALHAFGEAIGTEIAPSARTVEDEPLSIDAIGNLCPGPQLAKNIKLLQDMGIAPLTAHVAYGGLSAPFVVQCCVFELLFRACPSTALNVIWHGTIAQVIDMYGSEEIRQHYNPKLATGEWSGCMALTEAGAGSDLAALCSYGERQADGRYLLYGNKRFITNGTAEVALVLAKTSKGAKNLQDLSLFIVPRFVDGNCNYRVAKLEDKLALKGSATCDLNFDGAQAQLLGQENRGLSYMLMLMNGARIVTAFQGIGNLEAIKRLASDYAEQRITWGKKISQHELIAEKLADLDMELRAIRSLAYRAAFRQSFIDLAKPYVDTLAKNSPQRTELERRLTSYRRRIRQWIPLLKYWVGENVVRQARNALQIHGGYGFSREYLPEFWLRQTVILSIYEGTSQIQALMCIKDLLKEVLRNPKAFIERTIALRVKGLSESNSMRKDLNSAKRLIKAATRNLLYTLIKKNVASGISKMKATDFLRGMEQLRKNLKIHDFSHALLNAERICEMRCYVALAETLVWDAEIDSNRQPVARRFLIRALPQLERTKSEIEVSDNFIKSVDVR